MELVWFGYSVVWKVKKGECEFDFDIIYREGDVV